MAQAITTMAAKKSTAVSGIVLLSIYGCFCFLINAQRCGVFRLRQANSVRYMHPTSIRGRRGVLNVCPRLTCSTGKNLRNKRSLDAIGPGAAKSPPAATRRRIVRRSVALGRRSG
jgi:hypothetical protein